MMPVLGISFFIDGLHGSLSGGQPNNLILNASWVVILGNQSSNLVYFNFPGVLTGCGKQKIGAVVNLSAFYLAGIPMAVRAACVCLPYERNGMYIYVLCETSRRQT